MSNQSRKRFRARTCYGQCGDPLCSGSHVTIVPTNKSIEKVLDDMNLRHAIDAAEAMSDEEQATYLTRKNDLEGIPLEGGPNDD